MGTAKLHPSRVIFITYFPKGWGWVYKRPISRTWSFSYWVHVFLWRHTHSAVRSQDARDVIMKKIRWIHLSHKTKIYENAYLDLIPHFVYWLYGRWVVVTSHGQLFSQFSVTSWLCQFWTLWRVDFLGCDELTWSILKLVTSWIPRCDEAFCYLWFVG